MSNLDWVMVLFIAPCIFHKSTRVPALVLLFVFALYAISKFYFDDRLVRFSLFAIIDLSACFFISVFIKNNMIEIRYSYIALLFAAAVPYHALGWIAKELDHSTVFYSNACTIIVIAQILALYWRLIASGIFFKDFARDFVLCGLDHAGINFSKKHYKRAEDEK